MKEETTPTIPEVEKLYNAFANWYHDDGSYDTFLRSEAMKAITEYAASIHQCGGWEAIQFNQWLAEEGYEFTEVRWRMYLGGKYYWIQDLYKKWKPGESPCSRKVDELRKEIEKLKSGWDKYDELRKDRNYWAGKSEQQSKRITELEEGLEQAVKFIPPSKFWDAIESAKQLLK